VRPRISTQPPPAVPSELDAGSSEFQMLAPRTVRAILQLPYTVTDAAKWILAPEETTLHDPVRWACMGEPLWRFRFPPPLWRLFTSFFAPQTLDLREQKEYLQNKDKTISTFLINDIHNRIEYVCH
jgi:hypothetical protein